MRCLGAWLDFVKPEEVMLFLLRAVRDSRKTVIANHNAHSLYLMQKSPELQSFFDDADLVQVDSQPLILWSLLLGRPSRRFHRSTYLDWRETFWAMANAERWRVFFLGSEDAVVRAARDRLASRWPGLQLEVHHGYFDAASGSIENERVLEVIQAFSPDVLMVGMGMPRQELWIQQNLGRLSAAAILPVGGAFDYEGGHQVIAPRWLGRLGLEWAFRLALNPGRMFNRYCVEPWHLARAMYADALNPLERGGAAEVSPAALRRRGEWIPRRS